MDLHHNDCGRQVLFGDCLGLKFSDICLTGEEKLRKYVIQETYPDWGLNLDLVHEQHERYLDGGLKNKDYRKCE